MTDNSARNAPIETEAAVIADIRVNELKNLLGSLVQLIPPDVWGDVTRQILGVVVADALIVSHFPSESQLGVASPIRNVRDQLDPLGPVAGDQND